MVIFVLEHVHLFAPRLNSLVQVLFSTTVVVGWDCASRKHMISTKLSVLMFALFFAKPMSTKFMVESIIEDVCSQINVLLNVQEETLVVLRPTDAM
jgi:hypothetical protein